MVLLGLTSLLQTALVPGELCAPSPCAPSLGVQPSMALLLAQPMAHGALREPSCGRGACYGAILLLINKLKS